MPWQVESTEGDKAREQFKYQYHPGGDPRNPPKDAPSALHSVIVPNVNLPKVCTATRHSQNMGKLALRRRVEKRQWCTMRWGYGLEKLSLGRRQK